jgi:hypothetical protein
VLQGGDGGADAGDSEGEGSEEVEELDDGESEVSYDTDHELDQKHQQQQQQQQHHHHHHQQQQQQQQQNHIEYQQHSSPTVQQLPPAKPLPSIPTVAPEIAAVLEENRFCS